MRYLGELGAWLLRQPCDECVGLSRATWCRMVEYWTVRDAETVAALSRLVQDRPNRDFWKYHNLLWRSRTTHEFTE